MGCDIHAHIEKTIGGKGRFFEEARISIPRAYHLFSFLAGVRGGEEPIVEPRGFPDDSGWATKEEFEEWDSDAHTPSWLTLEELLTIPDIEEYPFIKYMKALKEDDPDEVFRLVFWFDN